VKRKIQRRALIAKVAGRLLAKQNGRWLRADERYQKMKSGRGKVGRAP
jgi:hypothetical protein